MSQKRKISSDLFRELTKDDKRKNRKWFKNYIFKYRWGFFNLIIVTILLVACQSIIPFILQIVIDEHLPKLTKNNEALRVAISLLLLAFAFVVLRIVFLWIATYFNRRFQQKIELDLKKEIYEKSLRLKIDVFDKRNEGYFIGLIMRDSDMAAEYARFIPENILKAFFSLVISITFVFYYNWIIGFISVGCLVILLLISIFFNKPFQNSWRNIKTQRDNFNTFFVNTISGIREIKNFTNEKYWSEKYKNVSTKYGNAWKKQFFLASNWVSINNLILALLPLIIMTISIWQIAIGKMEFGVFIALLSYSTMIIQPLNLILALFDIYIKGTVSLNRIFSFVNSPEEEYKGKEIKINQGEIEFKNVYLSYKNKDHALRGVSFKISQGQSVAFVGKTGAGKSTILKAILKHYPIDKGQIEIDKQEIKNVSVTSLRKQITYMSQEPFISYDTIEENIIFGNPLIKENSVIDVIEKAQANDFVNEQTHKEKTLLGPRGVTLSGGQKQRLALARTLVKKTKILLLDEATSALDNKVESLIQKTLNKEMKDATTVIIAHRLTTISNVDKIFVLDNGKIVEEGSWQELMKKNGFFKELVEAANNNKI